MAIKMVVGFPGDSCAFIRSALLCGHPFPASALISAYSSAGSAPHRSRLAVGAFWRVVPASDKLIALRLVRSPSVLVRLCGCAMGRAGERGGASRHGRRGAKRPPLTCNTDT